MNITTMYTLECTYTNSKIGCSNGYNYLVAVGHRRVPCLMIFPTRIETRGIHKHLASLPTSAASKCCLINKKQKIYRKLTMIYKLNIK